MPRSTREPGLDLARGLAVLGLLFTDYPPGDPVGPEALPPALFLVTAGVGATFLDRRGIVLRAAILVALGLALRLVWPMDLLLPVGASMLLALLPRDVRLQGALLLALAPVPLHLAQLELPGWLAGGRFALLPWSAFLLLGTWLADRLSASARTPVLYGGFLAIVAAPMLSDALVGPQPTAETLLLYGSTPPSPLFLLEAGAWSAFAVAVLYVFTDWTGEDGWVSPLLALGRMPLTAYLLHVGVGLALPEVQGDLLAIGTGVALLGLAWLWSLRSRRGPVEALIRRVSVTSGGGGPR